MLLKFIHDCTKNKCSIVLFLIEKEHIQINPTTSLIYLFIFLNCKLQIFRKIPNLHFAGPLLLQPFKSKSYELSY